MTGIAVGALAFLSTSLGGLAAVKVRDHLHLLLGFSAGAVLGVAFFDIFPEFVARSAESAIPISNAMLFVGVGFLLFFMLERLTALHGAREHEHHATEPHSQEMGILAAAGLSFHSFLDGIAIGVGFRTDLRLGLAIGLAVLVHDFADGLNTVTVVLAHGNGLARALRWLALDAITPLLGATTALLVPLPSGVLPYVLGNFIGFFVYIGASDLIPEARGHRTAWPAVATVAGMAVLFGVTRLL